jgi:hypothetical protein
VSATFKVSNSVDTIGAVVGKMGVKYRYLPEIFWLNISTQV